MQSLCVEFPMLFSKAMCCISRTKMFIESTLISGLNMCRTFNDESDVCFSFRSTLEWSLLGSYL